MESIMKDIEYYFFYTGTVRFVVYTLLIS